MLTGKRTIRKVHPADFGRHGRSETTAIDASGKAVFARGELGALHVLAHRLCDADRYDEAYALLRRSLDTQPGQGSQWLHLQFHLALCELELDCWHQAHCRFRRFILPSAATGAEALTDGPALLWWLSLTAPGPVTLPWLPLSRIAARRLHRTTSAFAQVHNFLALAGANDLLTLRAWLAASRPAALENRHGLLRCVASALLHYAEQDYATAAAGLQRAVPALDQLCGSRLQNRLFHRILARSLDSAGIAAIAA